MTAEELVEPFTVTPSTAALTPWRWSCRLCTHAGGTATEDRAVFVAREHVAERHPCPECGRPLDLNGDCRAGCLDHLGLDPSPDRPTSRDRFGGRNR